MLYLEYLERQKDEQLVSRLWFTKAAMESPVPLALHFAAEDCSRKGLRWQRIGSLDEKEFSICIPHSCRDLVVLPRHL